jgi:hypothetical protein
MSFQFVVDKKALQPVVCADIARLGGDSDGGYPVPLAAIRHATLLISCGLSIDWAFERDVCRINPGIAIDAYDHTVGKKLFRKFVARGLFSVIGRLLAGSPSGARKSYKKLCMAIDYFRFFSGKVQHHQNRVWYNRDRNSVTLTDMLNRASNNSACSVFAKIDIEGSEYRILPDLVDHAERFSGMVVEFHDVDICAEQFNACLRELKRHFYVVHVHGNNYGDLSLNHELPVALEISFIHKSLLPPSPALLQVRLPIPGLDRPNDPSQPDYPLCFDEGRENSYE